METATKEEFDKMLEDQKVHKRCWAFVCPMCKTTQSMASLVDAGCPKEEVHNHIGFSCEGRWRGSGSILEDNKDENKRGCNWTLGGFLQTHEFEVVTEDGQRHPHFKPASPERAQKLSRFFRANI